MKTTDENFVSTQELVKLANLLKKFPFFAQKDLVYKNSQGQTKDQFATILKEAMEDFFLKIVDKNEQNERPSDEEISWIFGYPFFEEIFLKINYCFKYYGTTLTSQAIRQKKSKNNNKSNNKSKSKSKRKQSIYSIYQYLKNKRIACFIKDGVITVNGTGKETSTKTYEVYEQNGEFFWKSTDSAPYHYISNYNFVNWILNGKALNKYNQQKAEEKQKREKQMEEEETPNHQIIFTHPSEQYRAGDLFVKKGDSKTLYMLIFAEGNIKNGGYAEYALLNLKTGTLARDFFPKDSVLTSSYYFYARSVKLEVKND